jgi:hypothetical protein
MDTRSSASLLSTLPYWGDNFLFYGNSPAMLGPHRGCSPKQQGGANGGVRDKVGAPHKPNRDGERGDNSVQHNDGGGRGLGEVCTTDGTLCEETY